MSADQNSDGGGRERRVHPRKEASLRVSYKSVSALVQAFSADISEGGLYLPARNFLPLGTIVELKIKLPEPGPELEAIARVAHVLDGADAEQAGRKPGMGMEFLDVGGKPVSDQIAEFLFKRAGRSSKDADDTIRARVLVVDDSSFHRKQTAGAMRDAGHDVLTAEDGMEALRVAVREKLDLILTDVKMPRMNGWHLLRMIRNRTSLSGIPVIFLTSLNSDQERLMGYKLGVDDYIGKGFSEAELLARVQRVLHRTQAQAGAAQEKALRGDLAHVSLASLLALMEMEQRTGSLLLVHGEEIATMLLSEGKVVRVDLGPRYAELSPMERFFRVLDWEAGQFELSPGEVTGEDTVGMSASQVILEHAKRKDESLGE